MGITKKFFFDTYALYEIIVGNENYREYIKDIVVITTKLNLMELHYALLSKYGAKEADSFYDFLSKYAIDVSDDVIKVSNKWRAANKKKKYSYVDSIGYTLSRVMNAKFLTGDSQFRDVENVEYVK